MVEVNRRGSPYRELYADGVVPRRIDQASGQCPWCRARITIDRGVDSAVCAACGARNARSIVLAERTPAQISIPPSKDARALRAVPAIFLAVLFTILRFCGGIGDIAHRSTAPTATTVPTAPMTRYARERSRAVVKSALTFDAWMRIFIDHMFRFSRSSSLSSRGSVEPRERTRASRA